jgi:hypothetical protein
VAINFPAVEAWDANIECVSFPANVDGNRIRCLISWEALQDNFGGDDAPPIDAFRAARAEIEAKAEQLIRRQRFESDGSVLIRSHDGP